MVHSLDRFVGKVAIVTGASAGIGAAIAEQLVEAGVIVAGFARRAWLMEENAKKLAGKSGQFYSVKVDITVEEEVLNGFNWVKENLGPVHILINNAGILKYTSYLEGETEQWLEIFNTNVIGLSTCTREAVKIMKENNIDGHIINMNSLAGHIIPPFPNMNVYPASKHAVTALTETLRREFNLQKLKIKVTSISPGYVKTEIEDVSRFDLKVLRHFLADSPTEFPMLQSKDVADAVLYILSTPPHVQIHELVIKPVGEKM